MRNRIDKTDFPDLDGGYVNATPTQTWVAVAVGGMALVGGAISADAAKDAGKLQYDAAGRAVDATLLGTRESNTLQQLMYQQNLANQAPNLQTGQTAQAALMAGLGLGQLRATPGQGGTPAPGSAPVGTFTNAAGQPVDQMGNIIDQSGFGGIRNYGATQADLDAGASSVQAGQFTRGFAPSDLTTDPSYAWRLAQGQKTLEAGAAARGGLLTGQGGVDLLNYGQNAASQEYGAAFDRNRTTQNDLYNRLANLAGVGQVATGAIGQAGQNAATQMGGNIMAGTASAANYLTGGASAQAGAGMRAADAWGSAINTGAGFGATWAALQGNKNPTTPGGPGYNYYPQTAANASGQLYGPPQGP